MSEPGRSRVYYPRRAEVRADQEGTPLAVAGVAVESVREDWLVEDRWWTPEPLRRRYFEVALEDGRCIVVFCEPFPNGTWFEQRA
jgi:hypothetical protein